MNEKQQQEVIKQLAKIAEQKRISKDEMKLFLEEAFIKAFNKEDNWDWKNPIDEADVKADVNLETGKISITKFRKVVLEINPISRLKEIKHDDPAVLQKGLKINEIFEENIDLSNLTHSKLTHLKQLLIQKTRETEKNKLFEAFIDKKGKLIIAKVFKLEDNFAILDQDNVSIFLPKTEMNPLEKLHVGKQIKVYVAEVDNISKDAQVLASTAHSQFVAKLLENENTDISSGVVKIEAIAREAGFKTKIAVSSNDSNVDPISSVIGPKGSKIKTIVDQLHGERIDVIRYSEDIKQYIADSLSPATLVGIKLNKDKEEKQSVTVIVPDDQFLSVIGKRGVNVKLASKLLGLKIDVKTQKEAKDEFIEYEPFVKIQRGKKFENNRKGNETSNSRINSENYNMSLDDILEGSASTFEFNSEVYETSYKKDANHEKNHKKEEYKKEEIDFNSDIEVDSFLDEQ